LQKEKKREKNKDFFTLLISRNSINYVRKKRKKKKKIFALKKKSIIFAFASNALKRHFLKKIISKIAKKCIVYCFKIVQQPPKKNEGYCFF
jgi:hypothetical protein